MAMLAQLWHKVTGIQPVPPGWIVAVSAVVALLAVTHAGLWCFTRNAITIAHEGGHALASILTGRRLEGIRLHSDSSGVTYSSGKGFGPGRVITAAAGYVTPSLLGAGAAGLLAARHVTAVLWLALVLLAVTFVAVRNAFGVLAVLVTAAGVFAVSRYGSALVQAGFAYLTAWFLLLGGIRPVLELHSIRRRRRRPGQTDADQLARLTGLPAGLWISLFALVALAAVALGSWLLAPHFS